MKGTKIVKQKPNSSHRTDVQALIKMPQMPRGSSGGEHKQVKSYYCLLEPQFSLYARKLCNVSILYYD